MRCRPLSGQRVGGVPEATDGRSLLELRTPVRGGYSADGVIIINVSGGASAAGQFSEVSGVMNVYDETGAISAFLSVGGDLRIASEASTLRSAVSSANEDAGPL